MQNWYMVDLRHLQVLRSVAQHGSVTAAAAALHLTPSAVSHRLKALAHEVGVAVLEPAGRGVRLTSAGHLLVGHADALYARWEQARADLAAHTGEVTGLVRLGGFPTAVAGLLSPAVARLRERAPRLRVRVLERDTATSLRLLLAGEIDLAVVDPVDALPSTDARVELRPLLEETLDLLVPVGHPLADSPAVALADLADEQWIAGAPTTSHHQLLLVACATAGFTPTSPTKPASGPACARSSRTAAASRSSPDSPTATRSPNCRCATAPSGCRCTETRYPGAGSSPASVAAAPATPHST